MCGPKFCSMHHSRTIEEGIAQMARELEEREAAGQVGLQGDVVRAQEQPLVGVSES
jgi:hypothetical protein